MPYTITPPDTEFAIASGSNVNSGTGVSTFDHPPNSTSNLIITSLSGDPSPTTFEVGDTYDVEWQGHGGGDFDTMTVIRSDFVSVDGDDGYVVVLEGTDAGGDTVHVIWTPDFDLENWYNTYYNASNPPGFYTSDTNPATTYEYVCFTPGARIAVPGGTKRVEKLRAGDMVETYDNGPKELLWTGRRRIFGYAHLAPILFEAGAIGDHGPLRLSPQHRILIEGPEVELLFAAPQVLAPAGAFVGLPGVRRDPCDKVVYLHLLFDAHELIWAENLVCESLLLGQMAQDALLPPADDATAEATAILPGALAHVDLYGMRAARPVLKMMEAAVALGNNPGRMRRPVLL